MENFRRTLNRGTGRALDVLLPRHCVLCGQASGRRNLCRPCARELPRIERACRLCGAPVPVDPGGVCAPCRRKSPPWHGAVAALEYLFPVDHLVCRFKFNRNLACGEILGRELLLAIVQKCGEPPGCVLPVPLHRARHAWRSFNQAELLARQVGKGRGLPVYLRVLRRTRRTRAQSGLDAAHRKKSLKGAFVCRPPGNRDIFRHVALVDDVMTTGATLAECTRVLQKAGAARVSVWVAARAPNP